ncbi:hypothetical protein [Rhizobium metallidurans]|uniref:Uncharacterized protein n=1 Tax=Rhizobium metallidurans TaxID=1265931 RepID=A0A7W6GDQ8_9HYPH|nr:hypothetical protein [Rhizobium metallidurans]MBB3965906.1 hypothetical protein [Rhizobium metallidurans]
MTAEADLNIAAAAPDKLDWQLGAPPCAIFGLYAAGIAAILPVLPLFLRQMGARTIILGIVVGVEALSHPRLYWASFPTVLAASAFLWPAKVCLS